MGFYDPETSRETTTTKGEVNIVYVIDIKTKRVCIFKQTTQLNAVSHVGELIKYLQQSFVYTLRCLFRQRYKYRIYLPVVLNKNAHRGSTIGDNVVILRALCVFTFQVNELSGDFWCELASKSLGFKVVEHLFHFTLITKESTSSRTK